MDCCSKNQNHQSKKEIKSQDITSVEVKQGSSKLRIVFLCVAGAAAGIIILRLMNIRIGAILPYAIFLLCPLMHIFMTHGEHSQTMTHGEHSRTMTHGEHSRTMKGHGKDQNKDSEHQH